MLAVGRPRELSLLPQALRRREAFPAFRPASVEVIETHISWVFLLEHDVFKVKKPVRLGFLDFSSLEQRRIACEAEVRLNARLAPLVYRHGVEAVRQGNDGLACIGGSGPVIDWAVHMVRLPESQRADQLLQRGKLFPEAVAAIATRLARFHAVVRCDANTAKFGTAEAVTKNLQDNFTETRETLSQYLAPSEIEDLTRAQTGFVKTHAKLFEQRIAAGRVRDGHGDLRLEHIYLDADNPPTVLDCIEFNERFRFADVCADIAFLAMDLTGHGRPDLSEHLLAAYAREANDFDLYTLVDFYQGYRAFIRGKVDALRASDETASPTLRQHARREARRHFLLALASSRPALAKASVIAVAGVIGSGKSTLATHIGKTLSAPVIDADRTRKTLFNVAPTEPLHEAAWQGAYSPATTARVYSEVFRRAGVALKSGRSVVIDASFGSAAMRAKARELAAQYGVPFQLVECRTPLSVCRERAAARERAVSISDGRLAIFDEFCARFEPITELPVGEHIVVNGEQPIHETMNALGPLLGQQS